MEKYNKHLEIIQEQFKSFVVESTSGVKNQAAALRARKLSMDLRNLLKEYRIISVDNDTEIRASKKE